MHTGAIRSITAFFLTLLFLLLYTYTPHILSLLLLATYCIALYEWYYLGPLWLIPVYPTLPFLFLIMCNHLPTYRWMLLCSFVFASCFDTWSYLSGKTYGRHTLAPYLSPGKTWEGFIGGMIGATITNWYILSFYPLAQWEWYTQLLFLILCNIASLAGDLFISYFKRQKKLKDTGFMLPGHGGILDRLDSVLYVSIIFGVVFVYEEAISIFNIFPCTF